MRPVYLLLLVRSTSCFCCSLVRVSTSVRNSARRPWWQRRGGVRSTRPRGCSLVARWCPRQVVASNVEAPTLRVNVPKAEARRATETSSHSNCSLQLCCLLILYCFSGTLWMLILQLILSVAPFCFSSTFLARLCETQKSHSWQAKVVVAAAAVVALPAPCRRGWWRTSKTFVPSGSLRWASAGQARVRFRNTEMDAFPRDFQILFCGGC